jgi:vacuolar-type H+-ATPase subunit I/STV1
MSKAEINIGLFVSLYNGVVSIVLFAKSLFFEGVCFAAIAIGVLIFIIYKNTNPPEEHDDDYFEDHYL